MKNLLPKIIVLIVALSALTALILVMLKNKEKVKETGKKVATKLHRKPAEELTVEDAELECCCDAEEADAECDDCECEATEEAAEETACDCDAE